ncbi:MAG: DUF1573 domain-containing protein [Bacteroidales bacterium]|jgi:hypothetical protein
MNNLLKLITMFRLAVGIVIVSLLLFVMPGCKSKKEKDKNSISTELVSNPITASGKKVTGGLPVITFEQTKHDFGLMVQGEKLSYTFKFTNTGGSELIISDCSASCGCTTPDWTKSPVKPGEEGKVEVVFNSSGKTGTVNQTVRLLSNAQPNSLELKITAEVYVPDSKK